MVDVLCAELDGEIAVVDTGLRLEQAGALGERASSKAMPPAMWLPIFTPRTRSFPPIPLSESSVYNT